MPFYTLKVKYENPGAYQQFGRDIQNTVKTKYGEKGAWDFKQLIAEPGSFPPTQFTIFEVPEDVSLDELLEVKLGEGVSTDIEGI